MHRIFFALILLTGLFAAERIAIDPAGVAQEPPSAGPGPTTELCSADEIAKGDAEILELPLGRGGLVTAPDDPDHRLYLIVITLPEGTCVPYHTVLGSVVLFVQEGSIEYAAYSELDPRPDVRKGQVSSESELVPLNDPVSIGPLSWITQDSPVWFTYRNTGSTDAVISMSAYVDPGAVGGCNGGCRKR